MAYILVPVRAIFKKIKAAVLVVRELCYDNESFDGNMKCTEMYAYKFDACGEGWGASVRATRAYGTAKNLCTHIGPTYELAYEVLQVRGAITHVHPKVMCYHNS